MKEHYILHHLRYKFIKTPGNYLAYCFLKGISVSGQIHFEICSNAGKKGSRVTKDNKLGIFSDSYDRSKQTKINHQKGVYRYEDTIKAGKIGGVKIVREKLGIHNPDLQHLRKEWAMIGQ